MTGTEEAVVCVAYALFLAAAAACGTFVAARHQRIVCIVAVAGICIGLYVVLLTHRASGVLPGRAEAGALIGTLGAIVLPGAAYALLGRALRRWPWSVVATSLLGLVPLVAYLPMVALLSAGFLQCPPGAYECPV